MGNPFDLAGPQFLAFYFVFSTIVILTLAVLRFLGEGTEAAEVKLTDPYLLAQLRAGKDETQRVAAAALLDRKLLDMTDQGYLVATDPKGTDLVRRPIEKALLAYFSNPADPKQMRSDSGIKKACDVYESQLSELGLLPDNRVRQLRFRLLAAGILMLWGVSFIRIMVAISRGRFNLGFLFLLSLGVAFATYFATHSRRTRSGNRLLEDMRTLMSGLKSRAESIAPGGATSEVALLAAVWGLGALPGDRFPFIDRLARSMQPPPSSSSSCGSSSSCSSSCGGGCGGGGCGGCGS